MKDGHLTNAFAAFCGEGVANLIRNPLELVKQQLMVGREKRADSSFSKIFKKQGIKGFYTGYSPTLLHNLTFSTIQMPIFEYAKPLLSIITGGDK
jgi:hypothetical protein